MCHNAGLKAVTAMRMAIITDNNEIIMLKVLIKIIFYVDIFVVRFFFLLSPTSLIPSAIYEMQTDEIDFKPPEFSKCL